MCRMFFCKTLDISDGRLTRAVNKKKETVPSVKDKRGQHSRATELREQQSLSIREHINSFPRYYSHYGLHHSPHQMYLDPTMTIAQMYKLYCAEMHKENKLPAKKWLYYEIFETFNLQFHTPSTDTCSTCDKLKMQFKSNAKYKDLHEEHLRKVDDTKKIYEKDSTDLQANTLCVVFDLQKTLPTPYLQTSQVFYHRQMWTYNLNIHDARSNKAKMIIKPTIPKSVSTVANLEGQESWSMSTESLKRKRVVKSTIPKSRTSVVNVDGRESCSKSTTESPKRKRVVKSTFPKSRTSVVNVDGRESCSKSTTESPKRKRVAESMSAMSRLSVEQVEDRESCSKSPFLCRKSRRLGKSLPDI